ncbi:hypothetical protein ACT8ZS_01760 [Paenibacillus sp. M.A.Huq-84]
MVALFYMFIFIRSEPKNPIHRDIIEVFLNYLYKDIKFDYRTIHLLINKLYGITENSYRNTVISELRRFYVRTGNYSMDRVNISIEPLIYILEELKKKIELNEFDKIRIMASSVHNYPFFVLGTYYCKSKEFWNAHINYYNKEFDEGFMNEWEYLFQKEYPKTDRPN